MFEAIFVIVPPGGGEAEYSLPMLIPALPREGDYVSVIRNREGPVDRIDVGSEDFIVRRVWWVFEVPDDGTTMYRVGAAPLGRVSSISVECEMAKAYYSCERHLRACGPEARTFEPSAY